MSIVWRQSRAAGAGIPSEIHYASQDCMAENLIHRLIPHQGCVITRTVDGIDIAGSAMNWVMSAGVAPLICRAPFEFRVVGKTDSTNLRMHWHRGELIFNWECSVRELRVHDPATAEQHGLEDKGFITTHGLARDRLGDPADRMRVIVDGEVRFDGQGRLFGHRVRALGRTMLRQHHFDTRVLDHAAGVTRRRPVHTHTPHTSPVWFR